MKKAIISFMTCALIGLGLGYVVFDVLSDSNKSSDVVAKNEKTTTTNTETAEKTSDEETQTVAADGGILAAKGCLGCHSVEALNLKGGATGPDLSQAFNNVEGKHGKPIDQFLKEPTSAVMSGVIGGNPLTDEEVKQIVELLQQASKK